MASVTGVWEFGLPEGAYKLTLSNGSVVDSPAISTYCYVGEIANTTTPSAGETKLLSSFESYTVTFPSEWTVALGDKEIRKQAYFEVNGEKQMFGTQLFIENTTTWAPTVENINITELTEAKVFIPAGTYTLTQYGLSFPSPEISYTFNLEPQNPLNIIGSTTPAADSIHTGTF